MSGWELVEEDEMQAEMIAALWRLMHSLALLAATVWAIGNLLGATFEIVYLDASVWPLFGWLALANLLVYTLNVLTRAISPIPR